VTNNPPTDQRAVLALRRGFFAARAGWWPFSLVAPFDAAFERFALAPFVAAFARFVRSSTRPRDPSPPPPARSRA